MPGYHRLSQNPELGDLFEFWTPTEVDSYAKNVAAGYLALAQDFVNSAVLTDAEKKAWQVLLSNFNTFYKDIGFWSRLSMGTVRTCERYAEQLAHWRGVFQAKAGKNATGATVKIPAQEQANQLGGLKTVVIVIGVCAGAYFGIELLKTVRVFQRA